MGQRTAGREDVGCFGAPMFSSGRRGALAKEVSSLTRTPTRPPENTVTPPLHGVFVESGAREHLHRSGKSAEASDGHSGGRVGRWSPRLDPLRPSAPPGGRKSAVAAEARHRAAGSGQREIRV